MNYSTNTLSDDVEQLAHDTSDYLESRVGGAYQEVRKGVGHVIDQGKDALNVAYKRALADRSAAERVMHTHLYQTICVGIGVGIALGFFLTRPKR